jgi:hypothetical protein
MPIEQAKIMVSARILRHISRGIYRTPAGALKELISNAHDAGALNVTINSGFPLFEKIVITDDGKGMTLEKYNDIIKHIGLSDKTAGDSFKMEGKANIHTRKTIGHYGIGLLAIGQLCKKVRITSKTKGSVDGFEALIDFDQFEVEKIDGIERSVIKDEEKIERKDKENKSKKEEQIQIGVCELKKIKYDEKMKDKQFTKIELEQTRDFVQKKLSGQMLDGYVGLTKEKKYCANFQELLKLYREKESEIKHGQYPYEKLIWELAVYCPVGYPKIDIFKKGDLKHFDEIAEAVDFKVVIDGLEITKPYEDSFFKDENEEIRKIFKWKEEKYLQNKKISGYLIFRGKIRPKSMQGVLVREGGVAVGMYDVNFLEYPFHEGPKFEQITGEIFVEGLSGALNIDRSSFNETDDTYLAMIKWIHNKLHDEVFSVIKAEGQQKRENIEVLFQSIFKKFIKGSKFDGKVQFKKLAESKKLFMSEKDLLIINTKNRLGKPNTKNLNKLLVASALILNKLVSADDMEQILENLFVAEREMKK